MPPEVSVSRIIQKGWGVEGITCETTEALGGWGSAVAAGGRKWLRVRPWGEWGWQGGQGPPQQARAPGWGMQLSSEALGPGHEEVACGGIPLVAGGLGEGETK